MQRWFTVRRYGRAVWGIAAALTIFGLCTSPRLAPVAAEPTVPIEIKSFAYGTGDVAVAGMLTIPAGTSVTWTNRDTTIHTATSDDGVWDSETLLPGESFTFTFTAPGTYAYYCIFHPYMLGTITVT